jgi:iron complex transport system substrate-binding protein
MRDEARGVRVVQDTDLSGIGAATPDVILGTKEKQATEYTDLSKIAPTIFTEGDDWKLNLREHGEALGRTNDSEELLTDWDNRLARVKRAIGDRKISVSLAGGKQFGPVGKMVLDDLGIGPGTGGVEVIRLPAGEEWVGAGGLLAARAALEDVARAL